MVKRRKNSWEEFIFIWRGIGSEQGGKWMNGGEIAEGESPRIESVIIIRYADK